MAAAEDCEPNVPKPPWIDDPFPSCWVTMGVAARYFKMHRVTVSKLARTGVLRERGFKTYFSDGRWFVRIPRDWFYKPFP